MSVYTRINEIREKRGVTWKYLNENIPGKVYSSRMTELKNGKTTLNGEQLDAIAEILGTTSAYLLGATDDPSPVGQKESSRHGIELSEKDVRIIQWFHSLPPETREAILTLGGGPKDLVE